MGKRKRKSKLEKEAPLSSLTSNPKLKKRVLTLPPQISIPTSQFQAISQMDACPPQANRKLWNRFYEPLILLLAYGKLQGEHVKLNDALFEGDLSRGKGRPPSYSDSYFFIRVAKCQVPCCP